MFTVLWSNRALDDLADIFASSDLGTQDRLTRSVEGLNRRLSKRPLDEGESRGGFARLTFTDLLAVGFTTDDLNRVVRVVSVKRYGR